MAIHCFYHSADLDGHCSGAIVKYRFPDAVMHPINYGDEFPWGELQKGDAIYLVDFSLQPQDSMERLANNPDWILHWIDHHKSAIEAWVRPVVFMGYSVLNTSKAACELTWEYLFPDKPVPLAVKLLSLYDSWTYQGHELEPMVLPFQMRMRMEDMNPFNPHSDHAMANWEQWFTCDHGCVLVGGDTLLDRFLKEGKLLIRYDEEQKRRYVQTYGFETELLAQQEVIVQGNAVDYQTVTFKAIAVNLGHTNSKVFDSAWRKECEHCLGKGHHARCEHPYWMSKSLECSYCNGTGYTEPYDLMITFCRRSDRKWNVSLYSTKPDIDCGVIAKSFGGGGHKGAAGFQCIELPFDY